ncbi:MAG: CehA/McbA family metallohydrolase [Pseudomonadales bacterium]
MSRRRHALLLTTALCLALWTGVSTAAELIAEQITHNNAERHIQRGPDAAGGLGDWALSNGTLCAIVSDIDHESDLSARGGALVDLGYCDRADDQFVVTQDLLDGSTARPIDMQRINARLGSDQAAVVSTGGYGGLVQETQISLSLAKPGQLRIRKRIQRRRDDAPSFRLLAPILFNYYSMETFLLSSSNPDHSTGFSQIGFSDQGLSAFADAARALDTIVALGAVDAEVPVAYGWQLRSANKTTADGEVLSLPVFAAADAGASAFLVLNDPFFVGDGSELGLTHLLQIALMGLEVGEIMEIEEILYVGRRNDVASITDQLYSDAPLRAGTVSDPSAVVQVQRKTNSGSWAPFSFVKPEPQGRYQLRLPAGDYQFTANAAAEATASATASIPAATALPALKLPTTAVLELPRGNAMRLVFRGINGTADPDLQNTLTGYSVSVDGETVHPPRVPMVFLAGVASDRQELPLPAGDYRVYATRGIEYSLTESEISLKPGQRLRLEIDTPVQTVPTPGYIATDLHVHSGPSMDNGFSTRERVRTFVAEHGEVMVATEHETLFDFAPLVRSMGVAHQIATVTGTEMTGQVRTGRMPHTAGHANFFPLQPDPTAFRRGVPANEDRRLREILYALRRRAPAVLAQLNHARANDQILQRLTDDPTELIDDGAYFDHMGPAAYPFNPNVPLSSGPNRTLIEPDPITGVRDIDFDALEILNGSHDYSPTRRKTLLADWFALLLQGERLTGTANSDSHGKNQQVALPRNMVAMLDDSIAAFDEAEFIEAIRAGRSYGTTGPLLELNLSGTEMGRTYAGQKATLSARVRTAGWVPADELRVLVNGEVVHTAAVSTTGELVLPLEFQADSFVLVEVEGEPTEQYQIVYPGHRPYAFSNPIYVDANSDGRWQPPGLAQSH